MGWTFTTQEHLNQKFMGQSDEWLKKADAEQPFGRLLRPFDIATMVSRIF